MKHTVSTKNLPTKIVILLVTIQSSFMNTDIQITGTLSTIITGVEVFLLVLYLSSRKYSLRVLITIFILIVLSAITYIKTGTSAFMVMLIMPIMIEKMDYRDSFKSIYNTRLILTIMVCALSLVGILDVYKVDTVKSGVHGLIGYGLGYTHPNRLAYTALYLILLYVCIKNERIKKIHYIGIIIVVTLMYAITKSRTLLVCTGFLLLLLYLYRSKRSNRGFRKIVNNIGWLTPIICAFCSIALPLMMLRSSGKLQVLLHRLNGVMGSRLTHVYRAFLTYPITLFGGRRDFSKMQDVYGYSTVDNGYIRLLFSFGVLGFIVFLILTVLCIRILVKKEQYVYILTIIILSIWGVSENVLENVAYNIAALFWCEVIRNYEGRKITNNLKTIEESKLLFRSY